MKHVFAGVIIMAMFAACNNNQQNSSASTDSTQQVAKDSTSNKTDSTNMTTDLDFATTLADAGMLEVKLGQLAQINGSSKGVKDFGQMMIEDHTKAGNQLKTVAASNNIILPDTLSQASQDKYNEFMAKKGKDFDKAYVKAMVDGHEKVLKILQKESDNGKNTDLKNWATQTIPTVQHHLDAATGLQDKE